MASTGQASCDVKAGQNRHMDLAETAEDALGHVNVVTGGATAAVSAGLSLNGDGLGKIRFRQTKTHTHTHTHTFFFFFLSA